MQLLGVSELRQCAGIIVEVIGRHLSLPECLGGEHDASQSAEPIPLLSMVRPHTIRLAESFCSIPGKVGANNNFETFTYVVSDQFSGTAARTGCRSP
jgi:hypothetical protein